MGHFFEHCNRFIEVFKNGVWIFIFCKDIEWKREWFPTISLYPKTHWSSLENCRKFLGEVAQGSNVQAVSDWRKVSNAILNLKGGRVHSYHFAIW